MIEEIKYEDFIKEIEGLSNEELMEFFNQVDEHIKYLNNSILEVEEE